ncbi:hypothetical protein Acr_18g0011820 [Actinidia rufa]|uniref:Uncharacterized protein n=1 Tax=Actinidia rufa TaxID=165716 RepID=A0A7J0G8F6_9ERIC|nr:hypothetical protein Acr_18g0011820 [Actinidia rufa]
MLVRDSEALAQFRVDHRIPDDVVIERPGPNDDADWVEGEGNRMPIRTWFIYQAGLRFPLSKLLRTVFSICGLTFMQISPRKNPETQMLEGNHYLRLRKPNQPQTRHRDYVPVGFNRRFWRRSDRCSAAISAGRPVLPPLQIRGPGSRPRSSLSDEVSDLFEGTSAELRRLLEEAEGESFGSSESSSSGWDIDLGDEALNEEAKVEDGEEVDQVPTAVPLVPAPLVLVLEPINLPSSDSDVAIVEPREIVEHSYSHSGSSSSGSQVNAEMMAPKVRILGKGQAPIVEPPTLPEAPVLSTPAPAEDQSIAPSLMGGKWKRKQPAEGTS